MGPFIVRIKDSCPAGLPDILFAAHMYMYMYIRMCMYVHVYV